MDCPRCDRRGRLYPVPAVVVTRELLESVDSAGSASSFELCGDCINELMGSGATV